MLNGKDCNIGLTIENIKIRAEQIRNEWKKQEKELLEQSKTNLNNGISEIQTCLF